MKFNKKWNALVATKSLISKWEREKKKHQNISHLSWLDRNCNIPIHFMSPLNTDMKCLDTWWKRRREKKILHGKIRRSSVTSHKNWKSICLFVARILRYNHRHKRNIPKPYRKWKNVWEIISSGVLSVNQSKSTAWECSSGKYAKKSEEQFYHSQVERQSSTKCKYTFFFSCNMYGYFRLLTKTSFEFQMMCSSHKCNQRYIPFNFDIIYKHIRNENKHCIIYY